MMSSDFASFLPALLDKLLSAETVGNVSRISGNGCRVKWQPAANACQSLMLMQACQGSKGSWHLSIVLHGLRKKVELPQADDRVQMNPQQFQHQRAPAARGQVGLEPRTKHLSTCRNVKPLQEDATSNKGHRY